MAAMKDLDQDFVDQNEPAPNPEQNQLPEPLDSRVKGPVAEPPQWSRLALDRIKLVKHPRWGLAFKPPGKFWVSAATLRETWHLFWRGVHALDPHKAYSAERLVCIPDWESRPDGELHAIGRCFKYFAVHGVLPITLANPEKKCNFKYRLNPGLEPTR